jgi:chromosome partitioning protein
MPCNIIQIYIRLYKMDVIAIANHKGGVGKTATTHALGAELANIGQRVLILDLDPQASLSGACGSSGIDPSLADVLGGSESGKVKMQEIIKRLSDNLSLAPSDLSLAGTERGLYQRLGRENVLKRALETVTKSFDVCLIDCPPSLSLLTVNALNAADGVLIPTQPAAADLRGLKMFFNTLDDMSELNPALEVIGILPTFYDGRLNHHTAAVETLIDAGLPVLSARIGRSVKVQEAAGHAESITEYDPTNKRATEYKELTEEINQWLKKTKRTY